MKPLAAGQTRLIWPWRQRGLHAVLALAVTLALFTHEGGAWHEAVGLLAFAAVAARALLGLLGPTNLRFKSFVRSPQDTLRYAQLWRRGREPRYVNHNPLGAWMVLLLLVLAAAAAGSGWLYTTDAYWGMAWVIALHATLAWALVPMVALHLFGVWHAGRRHHENLAAAMWHGRKRVDRSIQRRDDLA